MLSCRMILVLPPLFVVSKARCADFHHIPYLLSHAGWFILCCIERVFPLKCTKGTLEIIDDSAWSKSFGTVNAYSWAEVYVVVDW